MSTAPKLLVVDDEQVVCNSCSRIFESEGFKVDTCTDSWQGLRLATGEDYTAILLDMRIPGMDGLEFLDKLRQKNPHTPVIIITGHSSVQDAAAAMRLSAADYIAKPFTPDEITSAVRRIVPRFPALVVDNVAPSASAAETPSASPWQATTAEFRFLDESWLQVGTDGSVRVGAAVSRDETAAIENLTLPRVGDAVYRGLPLVALNGPASAQRILPSPLTGEVLEVNRQLADDRSALTDDPCHAGWIARIKPTALPEDLAATAIRRVLYAAANEPRAVQQQLLLTSAGCDVTIARDGGDIAPRLRETGAHLLMFDAASYGESGPALVRTLRETMPDVKVVVIGEPKAHREAAYREQRIHYYAVELLSGTELSEVLCSVFRPQPRLAPAPVTSAIPLWINRVRITNRHGKKVTLLASRGLIRERDGLGQQMMRAILDRGFPVTIGLGSDQLSPLLLRQEAEEVDHLVLLNARDLGQFVGSFASDVPSEVVDAAGETVKARTTTLAIQPPSGDGQPLAFDVRTTEALAELIVRELAEVTA